MAPRFTRTLKAKDLQVGDVLVESAGKGVKAHHDQIIRVETITGGRYDRVNITSRPLYGGPKGTKSKPQAVSQFFAEDKVLISELSPRYRDQ